MKQILAYLSYTFRYETKKDHVHVLAKMCFFNKYNISKVKVDDYPFLKDFLEGLRTFIAFKLNG